jgi:hypothetical protein
VTTERVERLIIWYEASTPSVFSLRDAARGLCDLVWMIDKSDPTMTNPSRLLSRVGTVVDVAGRSPLEIAEALGPLGPTGIVAFNDRTIGPLSAVAAALDLEFHSPEVTLRLTDKLHQRRAMAEAGVPVPDFRELPFAVPYAEAARRALSVHLPAVLKPRSGDGSRNVHRVRTRAELVDLITAPAPADQEGDGWLLESYLEGPDRLISRFADVVSVESFVRDSIFFPLAVSGRFPFAEPFRETGSVLPSDLSPANSAAALAVAAAAVAALGIRCGCQHTEVKFTPDGPVVIEVNGRVGGAVPELMALAGGDIDLYRVTMELALGIEPSITLPLHFPRVGFRRVATPPVSACRVATMYGYDLLPDIPGVDDIDIRRLPGTPWTGAWVSPSSSSVPTVRQPTTTRSRSVGPGSMRPSSSPTTTTIPVSVSVWIRNRPPRTERRSVNTRLQRPGDNGSLPRSTVSAQTGTVDHSSRRD